MFAESVDGCLEMILHAQEGDKNRVVRNSDFDIIKQTYY